MTKDEIKVKNKIKERGIEAYKLRSRPHFLLEKSKEINQFLKINRELSQIQERIEKNY